MIPASIYKQLRELADRRGGDMPDYPTMKSLANRCGDETAEDWLHNNMKLYEQIRIVGMEPSEEP